MSVYYYILPILAMLCMSIVQAEEAATALDEVVVTAPRMDEPLTVTSKTKAPQQPVPPNDGAALLKNVPGFSVIRKGGTDGDLVFRGLAGSRINLIVDGAELLGGCGQRMDPPTAYVFPEIYDRVTVLKGPQTVMYGNGNLAGVVLFDRSIKTAGKPGLHGRGSLMGGSWGRMDGVASGSFGTDQGFLQATISHAESDDYKDGDGNKVHSRYQRQSVTAMAGWTPDADTRIVLDAIGSKAEAAYGDRSMDGVQFDRQGVGLRAERDNLSPLVKKVSGHVYYNYIDHVMDNYSLRTRTALMFRVNNPDRETTGARVSAELGLAPTTILTLGLDWQANKHTIRGVNNTLQAVVDAYDTRLRIRDMETSIWGVYGEVRHNLGMYSRVIGGLRHDSWVADRYDGTTGIFIADANESLQAGFVRYEHDLADTPLTAYIGIGHAERPMDYWEASTYKGLTATSQLNPERNTQLDIGLLWDSETLKGSISIFYSRINDYILTNNIIPINPVRNIDAIRWGGELDGAWRFMPAWTLRGSLAYTRGENDTMKTALAQTPPLEARLGLDYTVGPWTVAGLARMVAKQDKIHRGYGNIVGQDIDASDGFTVLSLNASYRPDKIWLVSVGVDNLLDETYAEHISRSGAIVDGYTQTTRINEPGRFMWLKVSAEY